MVPILEVNTSHVHVDPCCLDSHQQLPNICRFRIWVKIGISTTTSRKCSTRFILRNHGSHTIHWNYPECLSNKFWTAWALKCGALPVLEISYVMGEHEVHEGLLWLASSGSRTEPYLGGPGEPSHATWTHSTKVWNHLKPCYNWSPCLRGGLRSKVQLQCSEIKVSRCAGACGLNRGTVMDVLLPYTMKAKECWIDPLNVDVKYSVAVSQCYHGQFYLDVTGFGY